MNGRELTDYLYLDVLHEREVDQEKIETLAQYIRDTTIKIKKDKNI